MAERRENSVLFSLKELRRIEDDRVKKEQDETKARVDAERAAKEAAERAARAAEEEQRRQEDDRLRAIEDAKESRAREDHMRLQEAERRARVEGEMRLHEERMRLEVQAKAQVTSPVKAVVGVAAVLVLAAGILGYRMYSQHQADLAAERARAARIEADAKAAQMELQKRIDAISKEMNDKLANAKTEEERARIRAEAASARAAAAAGAKSGGHRTASKDKDAAPTPGVRKVVKKDVSDNPLEGL